jgi:predicted kinase
MAKCLKFAEQAIKEGRSVVVDNTNPNAAARFGLCPCITHVSSK